MQFLHRRNALFSIERNLIAAIPDGRPAEKAL